jgi:hypothetical protein
VPIWVRNLPVVRARGGTCSMASVNEPRSQYSSLQRQRVLDHRSSNGCSP